MWRPRSGRRTDLTNSRKGERVIRNRRSTRRGNPSQRQGDEAAGTGEEESSIGNVTGTDHRRALTTHTRKGPSPWGLSVASWPGRSRRPSRHRRQPDGRRHRLAGRRALELGPTPQRCRTPIHRGPPCCRTRSRRGWRTRPRCSWLTTRVLRVSQVPTRQAARQSWLKGWGKAGPRRRTRSWGEAPAPALSPRRRLMDGTRAPACASSYTQRRHDEPGEPAPATDRLEPAVRVASPLNSAAGGPSVVAGGSCAFQALAPTLPRQSGLNTRTSEGGFNASSAAGRRGRRTSSPSQFGQTRCRTSRAHGPHQVHSIEQIQTSSSSTDRSASQHSQLGRSSSTAAIYPSRP